MVAKPLCPLYKNIIKPLDRARYPELRSRIDKRTQCSWSRAILRIQMGFYLEVWMRTRLIAPFFTEFFCF